TRLERKGPTQDWEFPVFGTIRSASRPNGSPSSEAMTKAVDRALPTHRRGAAAAVGAGASSKGGHGGGGAVSLCPPAPQARLPPPGRGSAHAGRRLFPPGRARERRARLPCG